MIEMVKEALFTDQYPKEVAGLVFIDARDFMLTDQQDEEVKRISHSDKGAREWVIPAMIKWLPIPY